MNNIFKKILAAALSVALLSFGYLYSQDFRPLLFKVAEKKVSEIVASNTLDKNDFKLLFCGTGSPNRTVERGQPCTALIADGKLFLFDAGEGTIAKLIEYGAPIGQLKTIFLTHLHSDHISGVAEVLHNTALYGRRHEIETFGPPGTEKVAKGFELTYEEDLTERQRVLGPENLDIAQVFSGAKDILVSDNNLKTLHDENGLKISAFVVIHPDWHHAYGYKVEYKGKSIVISGDTAPSAGIRQHAINADILIHEALNSEIFNYIADQMDVQKAAISKDRFPKIAAAHTTTLDLAKIAQETNVKSLIITHLIPAVPDIWFVDQFFTSGMDEIYQGEIIVARDGQWITL